jgi:hypothetical protein
MNLHASSPTTDCRVWNSTASGNPRQPARVKTAEAATAMRCTARRPFVTEACFENVERSVYGVISSHVGIVALRDTARVRSLYYTGAAGGRFTFVAADPEGG